ncbi:MAG: FAD-dependent oxidoreductase, partial [Oscillospiraceae bacterium]|nr:FAD-dependent oxidoreductase [Oscillospiraceae bacterium]
TVAVVGGGPGGMQAALLLKKRGYHPVLLEGSDHLGGSAVLASKAPCKGMVAELIETMKTEMKEYGIDVRLNTPGTVENIRQLNPYGVVVACGGRQIVPKIPGKDNSNVYYIEDVLMKRVTFEGKNIAVIGGGHVGLEVAHFLCDKNKVTVVEMQKEVGVTIYRTARYKLLSLLEESGVEILTQHAIAGVTEDSIVLKKTDTGETVTRPAEIVVMALGNTPDKCYEQQIKDAFDKVVFVGDAHKGGTMADATLNAYENCWFF